MENKSLFQQFEELQAINTESSACNVISISGTEHKLGTSEEGFPKFFIKTNGNDAPIQNILREFLSVEFSVPCSLIDHSGLSQQSVYSIITLRSDSKTLQEYFVNFIYMLLNKIEPIPTSYEVLVEIESLITIFTELSNPPKKKIQGLWAELFVIEQSNNPSVLLSAWHNTPGAKYDFTLGKDKIEVKSTSSEDRIHHFALEQLNPSENSSLLIASVIVRESGEDTDGLSIKNLCDIIVSKIDDINLRLHTYKVIAETLGKDLQKAETMYFDHVTASDLLMFYDYRDIPKIKKDLVPPEVSGVKFNCNLKSISDVKNSSKLVEFETSNLFKCVL